MAELTEPTASPASSCCSAETQASCCEPSEKEGCCGGGHAEGGCGCSAGRAGPVAADEIREVVREKYAAAARAVAEEQSGAACCGPIELIDSEKTRVFGASLYDETEADGAPKSAVAASLGCGVPTAVADLYEGETVLDLGSGAGADVLISARRVGPTGRAIGLDMTDEMLELARANAAKAGVGNVEFVKGYIEEIPLPGGSVDVIVSNCVLNLSGDKPKVFREAARVLRPGGRFAVSDIVIRGPLPAELRQHAGLWAGCFAGALEEADYRARLEAAGFAGIEFQPTRVFAEDDAHEFLADAGLDAARLAPQVAGKVMSAFVRAVKP
jgi:arsenite methyltransferase